MKSWHVLWFDMLYSKTFFLYIFIINDVYDINN